MRALEPAEQGRVTVAGFEVFYEVFGRPGAPGLLLLPTWQIAPSLHWRMQVPYLTRWFRVVAFDPPGIGGGERTTDPAAFALDRVVDDAVAVLDRVGLERAAVLGLSMGGPYGLWLAARRPDLVERLVLVGSVQAEWALGHDPDFFVRRERYEGWEKRNVHFWHEHYREWLEFFFAECASDPHSTKIFDDFVGWALQTTPEVLAASVVNPALMPELSFEEAVERVRCPVLIIHGTDDRIGSIEVGRGLAAMRPDWALLELEETGHVPHARYPVRFNLEVADFLGVPGPQRRSLRPGPMRATRRALFVSSPIGLGHIQRDLAIARELRRLVPGLEISWLAQHPVTRVLEEAGEAIHPMSASLVSESAHWERSSQAHALHCFYAWREMDAILLANFMVFLDAVRETPYDVWIGDEAWEVDHHLHENPELKTAPYVFVTDFLGWLPVSDDPREHELTADYNAEMLEQVARYPRVRDRALYVGDHEDLVPDRFGPGLPRIADWARDHFEAVGYVIPFDPSAYRDTRALRERLGGDPERPLVVCAVGGTRVGEPLLRRAIEAWPAIRAARPDARMDVVAGPRIAPGTLPRADGVTVRAYVHDLFEHLAAADLGIVQGGLGTTMELTSTGRPFVYFPLAQHCEQVRHVAHRLDRRGAGRRLDYATTDAGDLAAAAVAMLGSDTGGYLGASPDAATRAAGRIAELL